MSKRLIKFQKITIEDVFMTAMNIRDKIVLIDNPVEKEELYKQFQIIGGIYAALYDLDKSLKI